MTVYLHGSPLYFNDIWLSAILYWVWAVTSSQIVFIFVCAFSFHFSANMNSSSVPMLSPILSYMALQMLWVCFHNNISKYRTHHAAFNKNKKENKLVFMLYQFANYSLTHLELSWRGCFLFSLYWYFWFILAVNDAKPDGDVWLWVTVGFSAFVNTGEQAIKESTCAIYHST